jgi:DNA-binding Lrp family transcriptional regulator
MRRWGFLTNHALVLLHDFEHPNSTLREIADAVGITERATLSIVRALEDERIISHRRVGRRNHYSVDVRALMDHQTAAAYTVKEIVTRMAQLVRSLQEPDEGGASPQ